MLDHEQCLRRTQRAARERIEQRCEPGQLPIGWIGEHEVERRPDQRA
jgi:hypothetical protein